MINTEENLELFIDIENNINNNILIWTCETISAKNARVLMELGITLFFINGVDDSSGYQININQEHASTIRKTVTQLKNSIWYEKWLKEEYKKQKEEGNRRKKYIFVDTNNDHNYDNPTIFKVAVHNGISFKLLNLLLNHTYNRFQGSSFVKALELVNADFTIEEQEQRPDYKEYLNNQEDTVIWLSSGNY